MTADDGLVRLTVTCSRRCGETARTPDCYSDDEARDYLDCLGWVGLDPRDVGPVLCPNCYSIGGAA